MFLFYSNLTQSKNRGPGAPGPWRVRGGERLPCGKTYRFAKRLQAANRPSRQTRLSALSRGWGKAPRPCRRGCPLPPEALKGVSRGLGRGPKVFPQIPHKKAPNPSQARRFHYPHLRPIQNPHHIRPGVNANNAPHLILRQRRYVHRLLAGLFQLGKGFHVVAMHQGVVGAGTALLHAAL